MADARREREPETEAAGRDYELQMDLLATAAKIVMHLDLDWLAETVVRAHTVTPILDPTAYRDGMGNLRDQERLIRAAIELRDAAVGISGQVYPQAARRIATQIREEEGDEAP